MPAQFLFKDKTKAEDSYLQAHSFTHESPGFQIIDDYGQSAAFIRKEVHAVILEDMDLGEESRIQRGLSQARGQANANKRALTDPVLQAAARGQGPSVLTPFRQNGF